MMVDETIFECYYGRSFCSFVSKTLEQTAQNPGPLTKVPLIGQVPCGRWDVGAAGFRSSIGPRD